MPRVRRNPPPAAAGAPGRESFVTSGRRAGSERPAAARRRSLLPGVQRQPVYGGRLSVDATGRADVLTMSSALDRCARLYASRAAIIDAEATFTWVQHLDRVARAAGVLQAMGLRPGDRFGTLSRNTFRHAELLHAGYW